MPPSAPTPPQEGELIPAIYVGLDRYAARQGIISDNSLTDPGSLMQKERDRIAYQETALAKLRKRLN